MGMCGSIRTWIRTKSCLGRLGADGGVEFAGARGVPLTCECSSMSCMEYGRFFLFVRIYIYLVR